MVATASSLSTSPSKSRLKGTGSVNFKFRPESLHELLHVPNESEQPIFVKLQEKKQYATYKKLIQRKRRSLTLSLIEKENQEKEEAFKRTRPKNTYEENGELKYDYDPPRSKREDWWRSFIINTPTPGTYESKHFLELPTNLPINSSFKVEDRDLNWRVGPNVKQHRTGDTLLPGLYKFRTLTDDLERRRCSASFKTPSRRTKMFWEKTKNELRTQPRATQYNTIFPPIAAENSTHSMFKSKIVRDIKEFAPKEGPSPDAYDYQVPFGVSKVNPAVGFESGSGRFLARKKGTTTPGPGAYEVDKYERYVGLSIGPKRIY